MKRLIIILLLFPMLLQAQVIKFMGRYDVSRVDSINDSTWRLSGVFVDLTGSWTALDADTNDKILMRNYSSEGKVVFDRYKITGIDAANTSTLEVFVQSDFATGIQSMNGRPGTGSFPIASPTSDTSRLTYRASFYQNNIDPDYDAALDNLNLRETNAASNEGIDEWEKEVADDGENNWKIPFTVRSQTVIIYNGTPLRPSQWSAEGTVLTVNLSVRKHDYLILIN